MNEISFAAPEIAASGQRGTPAGESKLWERLRLDAERAAAILVQPSAEELKAETEEAFAGFDLPKCPACGGAETLLESVDPVNQWRCDHCSHTWLEESVSSAE